MASKWRARRIIKHEQLWSALILNISQVAHSYHFPSSPSPPASPLPAEGAAQLPAEGGQDGSEEVPPSEISPTFPYVYHHDNDRR
eukprot:COSAG01_NODE_9137_length_2541_cov_4.615479_1_plen_85_part_00